jgi:predicted GNAT family N-acyltransferase
MANMKLVRFFEINLDDPFFDSLKEDYKEFENWFRRKAAEPAYIMEEDDGSLVAFLYLKIEDGEVSDVSPPLPPRRRVKIGTFKINPHGTKLGERFIKKSFDFSIANDAEELYVTVFEQHEALIRIFRRYGFSQVAEKITQNGTELVLVRVIGNAQGDVVLDYPLVKVNKAKKYLLAIYPEFHTRLLPDSILNNEHIDILQDVSHTNSIHKVYICFMDVGVLKRGDAIITYRTSDQQGPARFRSVVTSLCVVEEVRSRYYFRDFQHFAEYCAPHSVFSRRELFTWWNKRTTNLYTIRFTYNAAFARRVTRGTLLDDVGLSERERWGFLPLTDEQFQRILELGEISESIIVH